MKINTFYNYNPEEQILDEGAGEVVTIPEQSLTVKDILEHFRRGTLDYSELNSKAYYDDDDNDIDFAPPEIDDITDIENLAARKKVIMNKLSTSEKE